MINKMKPSKSFIDWKETSGVFNDNLCHVLDEISDNRYLDYVDGEIKEDYLDDVFQRINDFQFDKFNQYLEKDVDTFAGEKNISIKQWSNGNTRMQLLMILDKEKSLNDGLMYTSDDWFDYGFGYAIIYGDSSTYLIVGNHTWQPFVYHPSFTFDNSDRSTIEDPLYEILNFEELKIFFKRKAIEYIFNQCH